MKRITTRTLWVIPFVLLLSGMTFAQGGPPIHAELNPIPEFINGDSYEVTIDTGLSVIPTDAWIQFFRKSITPTTGYDSLSIWLPASTTNFLFRGCNDGVKVQYGVRVAQEDDTTDFSFSETVTHDIFAPDTVRGLTLCTTEEGYVQLGWVSGYDNASGISDFKILRQDGGSSYGLNYVDSDDLVGVPSVIATEGRVYTWIDSGIEFESRRNYHYTVVAVDNVGNFNTTNPVKTIRGGSSPCSILDLPPIAPLNSLPRYTEDHQINVELNIAAIRDFLAFDWEFRYRMIDFTDPEAEVVLYTTEWVGYDSLNVSFPLAEECHDYRFEAQARNTSYVSVWSHSVEGSYVHTTKDMEGPENADSLKAFPSSDGIHVLFFSTDEKDADCGAGFMQWRLYRYEVRDTAESREISRIIRNNDYVALDRFRVYATPFVSEDHVKVWAHSDYDIENNVEYKYFVLGIDSLGHFSDWATMVYDTCTVDIGCVPPQLLELDEWTGSTTIDVHIVDTSHCDWDSIEIVTSLDPSFDVLLGAPLVIHVNDPILDNPDDGDCVDLDTLSFNHIVGSENRFCYKSRAKDHIGNVSDWSNIVCTSVDISAPNAVAIDSLKSFADSTNHIRTRIYWRPSFDSRIGLAGYYVYRSDLEGTLGTVIATLDPSAIMYTDLHPNPSNNFKDNHYTVVPFDHLGFARTDGSQITFDYCAPPVPVQITDVYYRAEGPDVWVYIEWDDSATVPDGCISTDFNDYRIEHSADPDWLFTGDPILIDEVYAYGGTGRTRIPYSDVAGSPTRYFQIATIDIDNQESGYSEIFTYSIDVATDSLWIHLEDGYNLFSLPVYPASNELSYVLPGVITAYEYVPGHSYEEVTELEPGKGYWVLSPTDLDIQIVGIPIDELLVPVESNGYHLVGGTFNVDDHYSYEGSVIKGPIWFDPVTDVYTEDLEVLTPSHGYWILFRYPESIWMPGVDSEGREVYDFESSIDNRIELNINNKIFELIKSSGAYNGIDCMDNPIPPAAPNSINNVYLRSEDGFELQADARSGNEWELVVRDRSRLSWNTDNSSLIIDGEEYGSSNTVTLEPGIHKVSLNEATINDFELHGAYPNPFNGATEIRFTAVESGNTNVSIYDLSGRKVWTRDDNFVSGQNSVIWNGKDMNNTNLKSGVYFCRITSGNQADVVRLLYVR